MRESERERAKLERESAHVNERERERESADRTAAAPRRERFRGRAGVLCFVLARAVRTATAADLGTRAHDLLADDGRSARERERDRKRVCVREWARAWE